MILKIKSKFSEDNKGKYAVTFNNQRKMIDKDFSEAYFDCDPAAVHYLEIEHITRSEAMTPFRWVLFYLEELFFSIFFFFVLDRGSWCENITPFKAVKKITFNPAPKSETVMELKLKNCRYQKKEQSYTKPEILIRTNCAVLKQENCCFENLIDINFYFIGCIIKYAFPALLISALLVWGIVTSTLSANIPLLVILSCALALIVGFGVFYFVHNIRNRKYIMQNAKNTFL